MKVADALGIHGIAMFAVPSATKAGLCMLCRSCDSLGLVQATGLGMAVVSAMASLLASW